MQMRVVRERGGGDGRKRERKGEGGRGSERGATRERVRSALERVREGCEGRWQSMLFH